MIGILIIGILAVFIVIPAIAFALWLLKEYIKFWIEEHYKNNSN